MTDSDAAIDPRIDAPCLRTRIKSLVLVCAACAKRSKAPKRMSAKQVAKQLRGACRDAGVPKPRTALTSCLGLCPKKAFTVVGTTTGGDIATLAFHRGDDPTAAVGALFPAYSNSTSSAPSVT